MLVGVMLVHSFLFFILLFLFFILLFFFILFLFFICCCCSSLSLLFDVIPHPSVVYCRVFRSILYFQPSPSQNDSRRCHFNLSEIFFHSFTVNATALSGHFFYPQAFFTLRSFTDILPALSKASLRAGSSSLKFAGLHTDPQNTDPVHLFV